MNNQVRNRLSRGAMSAVELFMAHLPEAALPDISRVILYGSRARGDHRGDSDIDIAIVLPGADPDDGTMFEFMVRLGALSFNIMLEMDSPIDVRAVLIWENELQEPEKQHNPDFYRNVLTDGIDIKTLQ